MPFLLVFKQAICYNFYMSLLKDLNILKGGKNDS